MRHRKQNKILLKKTKVVNKTRPAKVRSRRGLGSSLIPSLKVHEEQKICIYRGLGGIGDILMITPTLMEIKRRFPKALLTFAVDRHSTSNDVYWNLVKNAPFIDRVVAARSASRSKYDLYYDISSVCIPYERKDLPPRNRIDIFANYLGFHLLGTKLPFYKVEAKEKRWAQQVLEAHKPESTSPVIILHTASNDAKRSWDVSNQKKLVKIIHREFPNALLVVSDYNKYLREGKWNHLSDGAVLDVSSLGIREVAAIIGECDVFVGPDSGLMHIAGALEKRSVVLFGSVPPEARINYYPTHKGLTLADLKCLGCWYTNCPYDLKCMKDLSADIVFKQVAAIIRGRGIE